jgi:hypothetical protein
MVGDYFYTEPDFSFGKVLKYRKPNPVGEDMYLRPDGTIESDESKIISAQRIFKQNYYKAGGPWDLKTREKYASRSGQDS